MSYIDFLISLGIMVAAFQGLRRGLFRQAGSLVGFWAGIVIGLLLAVRIAPPQVGPGLRAEIIVLVSLTCASIIGIIGSLLGAAAAGVLRKVSLGWLDALAGALLRVAAFLVFVWIGVSFLSASFPSSVRQGLRQSIILTALDRYAPPVPAALAKLATLATPQALPKVGPSFTLPGVPVEAPPPAAIQAAVAKDQDSVVKVEGTACGSLDAGSGFVIAPGAVVTNAHVVAGADSEGPGRHRFGVQPLQAFGADAHADLQSSEALNAGSVATGRFTVHVLCCPQRRFRTSFVCGHRRRSNGEPGADQQRR